MIPKETSPKLPLNDPFPLILDHFRQYQVSSGRLVCQFDEMFTKGHQNVNVIKNLTKRFSECPSDLIL